MNVMGFSSVQCGLWTGHIDLLENHWRQIHLQRMLLFSYIKYLLEVGKIHLLEVLISPWTLQKTWHGFFPFFDGPAFKKKRSRRNGHCMFLNKVAKIIYLQLQSQKLRN